MNGILIINKQKNYTSHDIVKKVKKLLNEKVGHTGTLDPMATGVLPLLIGKGTLCSKYLINHDKKYKVTLELGIKTDTADIEGKIIEQKDINPKCLEVENVKKTLQTFIGKQEQIPPIYSAIKVKGKKLYEYARKGLEVEIKSRNIEIYNIQIININKEKNQIEFEVKCSKGTYIRSLCEDIAIRLGNIGYMKELQRTEVGDFYLKNSITLEELEKNKEIQNFKTLGNSYISIEKLFENKKQIELTNKQLELFLNGVKLTKKETDEIYKIYNNKKFIGIGTIKKELLKRDVIIL